MRQFESPPAGSFVPESAPWAVPGRPTSLVIQRVPCALREFQLALLDGKGGVGEWGSGGGCVAVTAIHSPNGAQDDSPRQPAWVTRAKEFTSHVRAAPHATMPLLTEEDWVTRFYHEVAPTALADTSSPDRLGLSQRDKIIHPGVARDEQRRLPFTRCGWSSGHSRAPQNENDAGRCRRGR